MTPCALMTGRRENTPARWPACTTRPARVSTSTGSAAPASRRWRSTSRISRTMAARRARGMPAAAGRSWSVRRSWSPDGRPRSRARSVLIEGRLDLGPDAADDLLRLGAPGLGCPPALAGHAAATHGLLREAPPQLVEVGSGQPLSTQGTSPVGGQGLDQTVALSGEPPGPADEIGETGRHAYSF